MLEAGLTLMKENPSAELCIGNSTLVDIYSKVQIFRGWSFQIYLLFHRSRREFVSSSETVQQKNFQQMNVSANTSILSSLNIVSSLCQVLVVLANSLDDPK